ncbi:MAG TPA: hypothetical protein PK331_05420 [Gordonia sp. (in: high G+C Gram-positive bacteria)]|uniref:hypothetical protein n=1 Tax=unclassified Gordonia (in: high G+C Gram-positive bacteria) TaxID=2657482 RepID=UPI000FA53842|nr:MULTISPECIES: hypothetical protein [unclassified Gordonia (in: high G+C Gram-positive bacteria)]RUP38596.1 MAG: hypothetical protein EKK60_09115 [Gordonia sp. (in: high G+C Gram-positive bacteria)]HNP56200.1 hypothetical protein [Gordonia sp. (in: high G+C Gram-positive bacteria)]HRC50349.1 hypothetical protein [Gordonia sp. (in: high G+C Gram-positive bacteria)]
MGVVLLVIGLVGLTMTVLSLIGLDIDAAFDISFDFADSGIGLLSLLTPFVTGFGLIAGGLMTFGHTSTALALGAGAVTGLVLAAIAGVLLSYLLRAGAELPSVDLVGSRVRVVEPVGPTHLGTGEVQTETGARQISITADEDYVLGEHVRVTAKLDDRNVYHVQRLPYDQLA